MCLFCPKHQDIIYLNQKRLQRDFFLFRQRDSKVTEKRLFDPQSDSKVTFGAQKVSFWSLLSLFVERGKSLFLLSFEWDKSFLDSGPVAASRLHNTTQREKTYTPKVFSALKTQVPQQAKKRFGVYQKVRREYHQSFAQPGFRTEKKGAISGHFLLIFQCFRKKKGRQKKTCAQPGYARRSGNSPALKKLVFEGKEGKCMYTREASRCLWGGPLRAALVYRFWPLTSTVASWAQKDSQTLREHAGWGLRGGVQPSFRGKSHPWTNTSLGGNFWRTWRAIGPYEFSWKQRQMGPLVHTNFSLKFIWTNGSQISLKVLVYTHNSIGP